MFYYDINAHTICKIHTHNKTLETKSLRHNHKNIHIRHKKLRIHIQYYINRLQLCCNTINHFIHQFIHCCVYALLSVECI